MPYHVISEKNASKLQQKNATYSEAKEPFPLSGKKRWQNLMLQQKGIELISGLKTFFSLIIYIVDHFDVKLCLIFIKNCVLHTTVVFRREEQKSCLNPTSFSLLFHFGKSEILLKSHLLQSEKYCTVLESWLLHWDIKKCKTVHRRIIRGHFNVFASTRLNKMIFCVV